MPTGKLLHGFRFSAFYFKIPLTLGWGFASGNMPAAGFGLVSGLMTYDDLVLHDDGALNSFGIPRSRSSCGGRDGHVWVSQITLVFITAWPTIQH
jgi:hypothetical protein